jgi:hypothetical protein
MALVTGIITDSAGNPMGGELVITIQSFEMYDLNQIRVSEPTVITVPPNGTVSVDLAPLEQPYRFEFYKIISQVVDGQTVITKVRLFDFYAKIPYGASNVLLSQLTPTQIVRDNMDTSAKRIAQLVALDPYLRGLIGLKLNPRGAYSDTAFYVANDIVTYDGGSYLATYGTLFNGINPTVSTHWFQLSQRGATGTGTAGNNTPYSSVGWNNQLDAPSRNAVRDEIENIKSTITSLPYAPINNPTFTGNVIVPNKPVGDNTGAAVNGATMWASLASILDPASPTNPYAPTPSATNNTQAIANTQWVWQRLDKLTRPGDNGNLVVRDGDLTISNVLSPTANGNQAVYASWVNNRLSSYAPLMAPSLTDPTANTPVTTDNSNRLATTAFVNSYYNDKVTSWANVTSWGTGWSSFTGYTVQYRLAHGTIQIRGLASRTNGTSNLTICTLPVGFRPSTTVHLCSPIVLSVNGGTSTPYASMLYVANSGAIVLSQAFNNTASGIVPGVNDSVTYIGLNIILSLG